VALAEIRLDFDELNSGELREKHAVTTWNMGIRSEFA
jgi:hypothetical protein